MKISKKQQLDKLLNRAEDAKNLTVETNNDDVSVQSTNDANGAQLQERRVFTVHFS